MEKFILKLIVILVFVLGSYYLGKWTDMLWFCGWIGGNVCNAIINFIND